MFENLLFWLSGCAAGIGFMLFMNRKVAENPPVAPRLVAPPPETPPAPAPPPEPVKRTRVEIDAEWKDHMNERCKYMRSIVLDRPAFGATSLAENKRRKEKERELWEKVHACDAIMKKLEAEFEEAK